jgi:DNA/RNA endonuclease YhcR with UshA esterase domain
MRRLKNTAVVDRKNKSVLQLASRSNFEATFCSDMHRFFAILGLLTLMIATHAGELPVINDSEAVGYVGKNVEVRGFVISVTTSPLGTAFINFGRDYPNQTFAGFIAAGSGIAADQRIAMLQGKVIGITGTIELYEGKPEIEVTSMVQIKGADLSLAQ